MEDATANTMPSADRATERWPALSPSCAIHSATTREQLVPKREQSQAMEETRNLKCRVRRNDIRTWGEREERCLADYLGRMLCPRRCQRRKPALYVHFWVIRRPRPHPGVDAPISAECVSATEHCSVRSRAEAYGNPPPLHADLQTRMTAATRHPSSPTSSAVSLASASTTTLVEDAEPNGPTGLDEQQAGDASPDSPVLVLFQASVLALPGTVRPLLSPSSPFLLSVSRSPLLLMLTTTTTTNADSAATADADGQSTHSSTRSSTRSVSRSRDFQSSGRGGIGNIRRASQDTAQASGASGDQGPPEDVSVARGREPPPAESDRTRSTGRGGVGNIRSSSVARSVSRVVRTDAHPQTASLLRDRAREEAEYERIVLRAREEEMRATKHSSGRGGVGNISRSKSTSKAKTKSKGSRAAARLRSLSRGPAPEHAQSHPIGRGGAGNVVQDAAAEDEQMSRSPSHSPADPASPITPTDPHAPHAHAEHTGRGGAGNFVRARSRSTPKEHAHPVGGLGKIWRRVARSHSRAPASPADDDDNDDDDDGEDTEEEPSPRVRDAGGSVETPVARVGGAEAAWRAGRAPPRSPAPPSAAPVPHAAGPSRAPGSQSLRSLGFKTDMDGPYSGHSLHASLSSPNLHLAAPPSPRLYAPSITSTTATSTPAPSIRSASLTTISPPASPPPSVYSFASRTTAPHLRSLPSVPSLYSALSSGYGSTASLASVATPTADLHAHARAARRGSWASFDSAASGGTATDDAAWRAMRTPGEDEDAELPYDDDEDGGKGRRVRVAAYPPEEDSLGAELAALQLAGGWKVRSRASTCTLPTLHEDREYVSFADVDVDLNDLVSLYDE
ncbi:hypothetical protein WOLCODRAFT_159192 [Wolfiporia cocos MD-104 SS10]|uniref:Uncharacterized protein n=1 Tax=Wolfiporia cocos (strain MD-104) TaxID=742152 RepID=A0A2H3JBH5_WOLCO|nr:hypothetical protein WOLCODRAFT_159192 [Wolfiporia cocos MD-104 SS10]